MAPSFYRGTRCWKSETPVWQVWCVKEASHRRPPSFSEALKNGELNTVWQLPITVPHSVTAGTLRVHSRFPAKSEAEPKTLLASFSPPVLKSCMAAGDFHHHSPKWRLKLSPEMWCNAVASQQPGRRYHHIKSFGCPRVLKQKLHLKSWKCKIKSFFVQKASLRWLFWWIITALCRQDESNLHIHMAKFNNQFLL